MNYFETMHSKLFARRACCKITLGDKVFDVHIHTKKRNKQMYLRVKSTSTLLVTKPPRISVAKAEAFVFERAAWINKQVERLQARQQQVMAGVSVLGVHYPFIVSPSATDLQLVNGHCLIPQRWTEIDASTQRALLCDLYRNRLEPHLYPLLEHYAHEMGVCYSSVRIGYAKSKWGSCSAQGKLFFNLFLAAFSRDVVRYLAVHELAHLQYRNHSSSFWRFVERHCPDYKRHHRQLRTHPLP